MAIHTTWIPPNWTGRGVWAISISIILYTENSRQMFQMSHGLKIIIWPKCHHKCWFFSQVPNNFRLTLRSFLSESFLAQSPVCGPPCLSSLSMLPSPLKSKISNRTSASDESTSIVLGHDQMMILLKCDCSLNLAVQKNQSSKSKKKPPIQSWNTPSFLDDLRWFKVFQFLFGALYRPTKPCLPEELLHRLGLQMPSDFIDRNGLGVFFWKAMERSYFGKP